MNYLLNRLGAPARAVVAGSGASLGALASLVRSEVSQSSNCLR